jgi:hypothetical protein
MTSERMENERERGKEGEEGGAGKSYSSPCSISMTPVTPQDADTDMPSLAG